MYVLDSSALIELCENEAHEILEKSKDEVVATTSICMHEVLAGARTPQQRFVFDQILESSRILDHDARAAEIGAEMERQLTKSGSKINRSDIFIAAVCKANDATLITYDKDFKKIAGLNSIVLE